ncbi:mobility-associated LCxxNW protein [Ruminococcus flavefaciens]|uniref:mobility-associated LCxxNW protein n=1 Tax=Ruminococcus flavefaciens TaxID=1265 RepID=UPI0004B53701|nr:mobility-associated LCxxNW protein [Ruminococcus flavefaciens]
MDDFCAFSQDHKCLKWEDYKLTRHELEEADNLCHGNWIEIQRLQVYIDKLKDILVKNDIEYPEI